MRRLLGWIILLLGFFILGFFLNQLFAQKSQPLSPIPNNNDIKVIMLSPQPTVE